MNDELRYAIMLMEKRRTVQYTSETSEGGPWPITWPKLPKSGSQNKVVHHSDGTCEFMNAWVQTMEWAEKTMVKNGKSLPYQEQPQ